jgi:A/G-specific adenine glycosylase
MATSAPFPSPARRAALRRRLLAWWDAGHRDLPWRFPQHAADPYRVWLAEVMLQQTRVQAVAPYYRRFLGRWPSLEALAGADDAEVLAAWSGLGYYARCRNLLAAARAALARHGGLPASVDALRALPGFGPYTAGAVASIAFAIPAPAVDGNVARVLSRLFLVAGRRHSRKVEWGLEALARGLLDRSRPGDLNQALMELGATTCLPGRPRCASCPVAGSCAALREGRVGEFPARVPRREPVRMVLALVRVERAGRLLLRRSPEDGIFPGMWGLPGLVVPGGEDPAGFLRRRAAPDLGLALVVGEELATVTRLLTHRRLELRVHAARLRGRAPRDRARWGFTSEGDASRLPASTAMHRVIEASGGWKPAPRRDRDKDKVAAERRKALTSRGRTV